MKQCAISLLFVFISLVAGQNDKKNETTHPCTMDKVFDSFSCQCTSIWDSDCYCEEMNNKSINLHKKVCKNCGELYQECWNSSRSVTDYPNITENCAFPYEKVEVDLITSSLSPTGMPLMNQWKEVLEVLGSGLDFRIQFLAQLRSDGKFDSSFGSAEIVVDKYMLCAMYHYTEYKDFYPFVYCVNQNNRQIVRSVAIENCAKGHNLDYTLLHKCVEGDLGNQLLVKNIDEISQKPNNPTIRMDGKYYMDYFQKVGKDKPSDYINALCFLFNHPQSDRGVFPWWVFTFMACIAIALLLVIWVAKSDYSLGLSSLFCGIFYEIDNQSEYDNAAREVLRLWQEGALPVEEEQIQLENNGDANSEDSDASSSNMSDEEMGLRQSLLPSST